MTAPALDTAILPSQDVPVRRLDPNSDRPPYRQVADALREAITAGEYPPGGPIPSRAELVAHFGIAPMTVSAAVRELRDEGWLVTRQGSRTFVRTDEPTDIPDPDDITFDMALLIGEEQVWRCSACRSLVLRVDRMDHARWHRSQGK